MNFTENTRSFSFPSVLFSEFAMQFKWIIWTVFCNSGKWIKYEFVDKIAFSSIHDFLDIGIYVLNICF